MIPTLKDTFKGHLEERIEELRKHPELLREEIDKETLYTMEKALHKLETLFKMPEFKNLESFHLGLRKGYQDLKTVLGYGDIMSWAHHIIPKGLTAIGRLNKFESGVIRTLQKLPSIISIARGGEAEWRRQDPAPVSKDRPDQKVGWDPSKPIESLVSDETHAQLQKIIIHAMQRGEGKVFSDKLPYIDNEEAARELLTLSFNDVAKLAQAVSRSPVLSQADSEAAAVAQDAVTDEKKPAAPAAKKPTLLPPKPEAEKEKQVPPVKATVSQNAALRELNSIASDIGHEIFMSKPDGSIAWGAKAGAFKEQMIVNTIGWLIKQGFVKGQ